MKRDVNRLRVLRAERRITQMLLWRKCGIAPARISFIENGVIEPTDQEKAALAKALKVTVAEAFPPLDSTTTEVAS